MDDHIPIEDEVFVPNSFIVADIIFDSPKQQPANTTTMVQRRGSEAVMNYTRYPDPSNTGEPHVHFEDGRTTRMKSYEPPMPTPPQYYPGRPQAAYPLSQQQQPPYQQQQYYPPPPNQGTPQMGAAPVPIPPRRDSQNRSISYGPQYPQQPAPYSGSPMAYPPQPAHGSWPPANYYQPPPPTSNNLGPWQAQPSYPPNPSTNYFPGPGPSQGTTPFYPLRSALRNRTSSTSSYNSHSSNRYNDESPIYESDEDDELDEKPKRHRRHSHTGSSGHHHHHRRTSSFHGDRGENKYTGAADHASLGDTLSLIWDGLSGAMGKPRRY